jgi:tetratricopeptide (TPR) repeat protein/predicted Ser/Thr protein kinase
LRGFPAPRYIDLVTADPDPLVMVPPTLGDAGDDLIAHQLRNATMAGLFGAPARPFRFGRFVVQRELGRGGQGVVYEAVDERLGRTVALKVIRDARADAMSEATLLASVDHPGVVTVFDVETQGDVLLVAMRLVTGQALTRWAATGPPRRRRLDVLRQVGAGLMAIHRAGIVHGDIKPDNVLVDASGRAQITDFGLARLLGTSRRGGTPGYLAPEQFAEAGQAPSDVLAYCVLIWEVLTDRRVARGRTVEATRAALAEVRARCDGVASPVPWRRLRRVLSRGLAEAPTERPSVAEVHDALVAAQRRPRRLALAASAVALAGAGAVATYLVTQAGPSPAQACLARVPTLTQPPLTQARSALATLATSGRIGADLAARLGPRLAQLDGTLRLQAERVCRGPEREQAELLPCLQRVKARTGSTLALLAQAPAAETGPILTALHAGMDLEECQAQARGRQPLPDDPAAQARIEEVYAGLAQVAAGVGVEPATRLAAVERLVEGAVATGYAPVQAAAQLERARVLREQAAAAEAARAAREALLAAERGRDDRAKVRAYLALAAADREAGQYESARGSLELADAAATTVGGLTALRVDLLLARAQLALRARSGGDDTIRAAAAAVTLAREIAAEPSQLLEAMVVHSEALRHGRRLDEAVAVGREAVALQVALAGPDHPETHRTRLVLAGALSLLGDPAAAGPLLDEVITSLRATQVSPSLLAQALDYRGAHLTGLGRDAEAVVALTESLQLKTTLWGEHSPRLLTALHNLAYATYDTEPALGAEVAARGHAIAVATHGEQHEATSWFGLFLAHARLELDPADAAAVALADQSIAAMAGFEDEYAAALGEYGDVMRQARAPAKALAAYQHALRLSDASNSAPLDRANLYLGAAKAHHQGGQSAAARRALQRALDELPRDEEHAPIRAEYEAWHVQALGPLGRDGAPPR